MRQNLFKGAAAEYRAASYYMERGEIVYWPAVPLESDFIVERKDGRLEKIQVKYTSWNKDGAVKSSTAERTAGTAEEPPQ